jgi:trk system potassium uptake protein
VDLISSIVHRHRLHWHTTAVLSMSATIYLIGLGLIVICECSAGSLVRNAVVLGSAESLNSRTLGLPLGSFGSLSRASQWVVLVLMMIGGNPASTAGGIKTTTLFILARDSARLIRGEDVGRLYGFAVAWCGTYLLAIAATTLLLIGLWPEVPADRLLFMAVSAIGNVGTSHEPISFGGAGLHVLTFAMLFGRFAPLALLYWAARNTE